MTQPTPLIFDRACIITVVNNLPSASLECTSYDNVSGKWSRGPPASRIGPKMANTFELTDRAGSPWGAEGRVFYKIGGSGTTFILHFNCPLYGDNSFSSGKGQVDFNVTGAPLKGTVYITP